MRYLLLVLVLVGGCFSNPFDSVIMNHLDDIHAITEDEFTVEFYLEHSDDLNKSTLSPNEILQITKLYYEKTQVETLKYVMLYIPHNVSTWHELMHESKWYGTQGAHTTNTNLGDYIILINPESWISFSKTDLIQIIVHELTHQVCEQHTGNTDPNHTLDAYWGNNGFMWTMITELILTL